MDADYEHTAFRGQAPDFSRVLFLEFEGVLNSESYFRDNPEVLETLRGIEHPGHIERPSTLFDPKAVGVLQDIVDSIEPAVIITSSWREYYSLSDFEGFLREHGYTGGLDAVIREGDQINPSKNEIILWCEEETDPDDFLVLDTQNLRGIDNLLAVDSTTGLTPEDGRDVINHFQS